MRWSIAVDGFWLTRKRDLSKATVKDYSRTFDRFGEFIHDGEIESITSADINRFLNHLQDTRNLSGKSLSNVWIALSAFFTWAESELGINHVIRGQVRRPKYRTKPIKPYSHDEIRAILYEVSRSTQWVTRTGKRTRSQRPTARRDSAIILVLLDTGIRASELCNLKTKDYQRNQQALTILHGKGDKQRTVFLGDTAHKHLWRYLADRQDNKPGDPLFATKTNRHISRDNLRHTIQRIAERAGVHSATVHRFRHTFAIQFLRNRGNVLELKQLLGHEAMSTIEIYVELAQVDLQNAQRRSSPADNWNL